jgi:nodulation protein S (NodS)
MIARLPDEYFGRMYEESADPWQLQERWYEQRKFAITLALLPLPRFRHAFEPGCSVGVLTEQLAGRCDRVTATDLVPAALEATARRLKEAGVGEGVTLMRRSLDEDWPATDFDLIVLSEVGYYLEAAALRGILDRELPRLTDTATVVAAHWRHPVADYPMTGDETNDVIAASPGLHRIGGYRDDDVTVDVFDTATSASVAERTGVPGASPSRPE